MEKITELTTPQFVPLTEHYVLVWQNEKDEMGKMCSTGGGDKKHVQKRGG